VLADGSFAQAVVMPQGVSGDVNVEALGPVGSRHLAVGKMLRTPVATAGPFSGGPGRTMTYSLSGMPGEIVDVMVGDQSFTSVTTGTAVHTGTFGLPALLNGSYSLRFRGRTSGAMFSVPFEVVGSLSLGVSAAAPGTAVPISVTGYQPNEALTVYFGATPTSATADASGAMSGNFVLPEGTAGPIAMGVFGASGFRRATLVRVPSVSLSATGVGPGPLAQVTGKGFLSENVYMDVDGFVLPGAPAGLGFTASVALPASSDGDHVLRVRGSTSGTYLTVPFTIAGGLTVVPNGGPAGTSITYAGSGFGANETVQVQYLGAAIATTTSNAAGAVSGSFALPAGTPRPIGVTLRGTTSSVRRTVTLVRQ
jgi:hypothetical protein